MFNNKNKPNNRKVNNNNKAAIKTAPVAKTRNNVSRAPNMTGLPRGSIRVRHREYFADVSGSVGYNTESYPVNPGLPRLFPWLSKIASRYESYKFESLRFLYETEAPTTATGVTVLAIDYDPTDEAPLSKTAILSYEGASRSAPWDENAYTAKKNDLSKRKSYFVRCGTLPSTATLGLHDVGNLFVATQGQGSTATIGELYVEYDIVLSTPQTDPSSLSKRISGSAGITNALIFGTSQTSTGCLDVSVTASTITFNQSAQSLLVLSVGGTGIIAPVTSSSTATVGISGSTLNAAGTGGTFFYSVRAQPGEAVTLDMTGSTSVSLAIARLGEYQVSLA